jgi:hypothetical protein
LDEVEHSWELRTPLGDRNKFRSTLRWTRASRTTRQTWTRVNVSENCYKFSTFKLNLSLMSLRVDMAKAILYITKRRAGKPMPSQAARCRSHTHACSRTSGTECNSTAHAYSTRRRGIQQVKGTNMRRIWLLVLVAVLLASCGMPQPSGVATPVSPGGTPSTGQNEKVTISFAVWEYERSVYQPLAERFMSEHPNINVGTCIT